MGQLFLRNNNSEQSDSNAIKSTAKGQTMQFNDSPAF